MRRRHKVVKISCDESTSVRSFLVSYEIPVLYQTTKSFDFKLNAVPRGDKEDQWTERKCETEIMTEMRLLCFSNLEDKSLRVSHNTTFKYAAGGCVKSFITFLLRQGVT
jgi:hypothetical protein